MRMKFSGLLLFGCLTLSACSLWPHRASEEAAKKTESSAIASPASKEPSTDALAQEKAHWTQTAPTSPVPDTALPEAYVADPKALKTPPVAAATPAAPKEPEKFVRPEKALGWLKNGNLRYLKHNLRKDGQSSKDIQRLSNGQSPHSIILSCSDSRVPPEIVFDQKLGEIFVVRNAGEVPDQAAVASIEYAVEHLGTRLLVVMGHTQCGAVKAALDTLEGGEAGSPALNALVHDMHTRLARYKGKPLSPGLELETWTNASGIAKDLLERSEIIRRKVASGELVIKTALYHLDNGKVDFDQ